MKTLFACAGALVLLGACGISKEANAGLEAMNIANGQGEIVKFASKSGSGDKITLKDVTIGKESEGLKAASMVLDGLHVNEAGAAVLSGVTLTDISPGETIPGGALTISSLSMTGMDETTGAFIAKVFKGEDPGDPPPFEQWVVGEASLNGLRFTGDLSEMGQGDGSFDITVDKIAMDGVKGAVINGFNWNGIKGNFAVPPEAAGFEVNGTFDLGTMAIRGIQGGTFAQAFEAGLASAMNPAAAQTMPSGLPSSPIDPGFNTANWSGMNINAAGLAFTTSEMSSRAERNADGIVTSISSPRASLKLAIDNDNPGMLGNQAQLFMGMVGYSELELYSESEGTFDPATDTTRYNKATFGLTDGFDISLNGGFQGVHDALEMLMTSMNQAGGQPDMSGLETLKIVDMKLQITDNSLMDKLFNLAPMLGGGDPATMRADLVSQLTALGDDMAEAGVDPAISNELSAAIANFIQNPGVLTVTLKPTQPVSFAAPNGPLTKSSLGFSADYEAK